MSTVIFVIVVGLSLLSLLVAWFPKLSIAQKGNASADGLVASNDRPEATGPSQPNAMSPNARRWMTAALMLAMVPLMFKSVMALNPAWEIAVFPIALYAPIQRDYWWPFLVLAFALSSRLVPQKSRRSLVWLSCLLVGITIHQTAWRVLPSPYAHFAGKQRDGVCMQSTDYTCVGASLVTMLHTLGIRAGEGEMAALAHTVPRGGATDFQAADALQRKLDQSNLDATVTIRRCEPSDLANLPTPCLVAIKHSFWFDHMVCLLEVQPGRVILGDPLQGKRMMRTHQFLDAWRKSAVTVAPAPVFEHRDSQRPTPHR